MIRLDEGERVVAVERLAEREGNGDGNGHGLSEGDVNGQLDDGQSDDA